MSSHTGAQRYFIPHNSPWSFAITVGFFALLFGTAMLLSGMEKSGLAILCAGAVVMIVCMVGWWRLVIHESESRTYRALEDSSFRWGMVFFIFSEVCFFGAFFGALFYSRLFVLPFLSGASNNLFTEVLLWPGFVAQWPSNGPGNLGGTFEGMTPGGIAAMNTALLFISAVTVTIAHWGLKNGHRNIVKVFLALTFFLGFTFVVSQAHEYIHAYQQLGLTLGSGIYGTTFFVLTGFHGTHVTIGAIALLVIWVRVMRGHFDEHHHFGFEAIAWYWHFVDVVWLGLYLFVYWL
ncbi:MAG: cytochrome c oxidase subunit 3 [Gammaproteobacteria bacterium]|nr:cytochrome c oxidase subunit 3 [Gammaproteobacteria bacterium]